MSAAPGQVTLKIRPLVRSDLTGVIRIDAHHTGSRKPAYWGRIFKEFLGSSRRPGRVGLAAEEAAGLIGYLLGEVRAFEFGSEPCGWVFAVGVDPERRRAGTGSALVAEACRRFREAGVRTVRTMVRREDVPMMSFFRSNRFKGGRFVQLELDLEDQTS